MNIASRLLLCSATLGFVVQLATGCANVSSPETSGSGGGKGSGGNKGGTGSSDGGVLPPVERPMFEALPAAGACGNGKHDDGEECDDGNSLDAQNSPDKKSDGCTRLCQIEAGWKCPEVGKCDPPQCGDGILAASEACDDKNTDDGDGCSKDCKTVDDKYECRVPGKRCVPKCGDGHKVGSEGCDDGNTMDGDGCSGLCLVEPGSSCDTSKEPSTCTKSVCGNGKVEAGESCDNGNDATNVKRNGVFLGDGMGCSKTCTTEPTCRDKNGKNQACTAVCGDGNLDMSGGEECDDGNHASGDGCSKDCKTEQGFMCDTIKKPDTSPCANGTGTCLQLPVVYRDFKSQHETGGHPDFFYHSTMQQCIPNTSGPARCGDATARCWGIVQDNLMNGKPQLNGSPTCPCQFTDWSVKNDGNHVPGYTGTNSPITMSTSNNSGAPVITATAVPIVKSKTTFDQWFNDSTGSSPANMHTVGTLELSMLAGAQNRYRFSSDPDAVKGGFFPLDATPMNTKAGTTAGGEPLLCNLWPYWYSTTMFGAGAGCKGDQYLFPPSVPAGTMCDANGNPNCVNGAWVTGLQGFFHNAWFTDEVHYYFTFTDAFDLQFYGDDDLFIFVNGVLVIDLGGVHQRLPGKVTIGDDGNATITEGGYTDANGDILPCPSQDPLDPTMKGNCKVVAKTGVDCRQRTVSLGLKKGSTYEIAIFGADRGATESNYQLTLNGFATNQTVCTPRCGDGVTTGAEECDCSDGSGTIPDSCNGQKNDDHVYGGCTTQCKYGSYCGDGHTDSDGGEVCDEGKDNGATYSDDPSGATGCSVTCQRPHFCGDGHPDAAFGEQCDLGDKNGQVIDNGGGKQCVVCDSKCQIRPEC